MRGCPLPHFFLGYGRGWRRNAPPSGEDPARGEGLVEAVRIGAISGHFWLAHGRTVGGTPPAGLPRGARGLRGLSRGHSRLQTTPFVNSQQKLDFSSFFLREKKKKISDFSLQRAKIFALAPQHACESRSPRALRCSWSPPTAPAPRWEASLWFLSPWKAPNAQFGEESARNGAELLVTESPPRWWDLMRFGCVFFFIISFPWLNGTRGGRGAKTFPAHGGERLGRALLAAKFWCFGCRRVSIMGFGGFPAQTQRSATFAGTHGENRSCGGPQRGQILGWGLAPEGAAFSSAHIHGEKKVPRRWPPCSCPHQSHLGSGGERARPC